MKIFGEAEWVEARCGGSGADSTRSLARPRRVKQNKNNNNNKLNK